MLRLRIVDCHAHIFPPLRQACGFRDAQVHLLYQQFSLHLHGNQPVRRLRDGSVVAEKHLWEAGDPSERGRRAVGFRPGCCGRFEWEWQGEGHYIQFLPPAMADLLCPAEVLVAQMDNAGVDAAVLQNDHLYGNLSGLFAQAMARYPGRFIGTAAVEEAFAHEEGQIQAVRDACLRLGMAALYFTTAGFVRNGYRTLYDDPQYRPFWQEVAALEVPVFWVFYHGSPAGTYDDELRRFRSWLEVYGHIPSVLVHGVPTALYADAGGRLRLPPVLEDILREFPVYLEILFPISWGRTMDYPFAGIHSHIRQLYDRVGPERLLWGSDMPNVERYCTYRQSLTYLTEHCDFLSPEDLRRLLFGNVTALLSRAAAPGEG